MKNKFENGFCIVTDKDGSITEILVNEDLLKLLYESESLKPNITCDTAFKDDKILVRVHKDHVILSLESMNQTRKNVVLTKEQVALLISELKNLEETWKNL